MAKKLFRIIVALPILLILIVSWIIMLSISIIPLLILFFFNKVTKKLSYNSKNDRTISLRVQSTNKDSEIVFNRIDDVSKIIGCNTRNVQYRWNIFTNEIKKLQSNSIIKVLDCGAGSLRDTYELSVLGFEVDSIDLNKEQLMSSYNKYDWTKVRCKPNIQSISITNLDENHSQYDLILAFDVVEHLLELDDGLEKLRNKLSENGSIFISVPNRLSFFETYFKFLYKRQLRKGFIDKSGIPHVNFYTPQEWKQLFIDKGFNIIDHDMTIGFFVNDWNGFYDIPTRIFITPIIHRLFSALGMRYNVEFLKNIFAPRWLMKLLNELDETTKKYFANRWGWNLFVLSRSN
jgi:2-polyprenyl-3-methyl-5-hydroxy-6-metoxy-1,4-benzoquinol methylase